MANEQPVRRPRAERQALPTNLTSIDETGQSRLLTAFCDQRRRRVLRVVLEGSTTVEELATRLAAREAGATSTADRVRALRGSLHHVHLPKLDATGFVTYDAERGQVMPGWSLLAVVDCLVTEDEVTAAGQRR